MVKGKQVGIWIRVSTEDQARGESPEHQGTAGICRLLTGIRRRPDKPARSH